MSLIDIFFCGRRFDEATMSNIAKIAPELVYDALGIPTDERKTKPLHVRSTPHSVHDANMPPFMVRIGLHEDSGSETIDFDAFKETFTELLRGHLNVTDKAFVYDGLDSPVKAYRLPREYVAQL